MTNRLIPTLYSIRNWGTSGDIDLEPSSQGGNLLLSGANGSGKTTTMSTIFPLLIAGNLKSSHLFNTFNASTDISDKVVTRNRTNQRNLAGSILADSYNSEGKALTDKVASSRMTVSNDKEAITFGVVVSIKNKQLSKYDGQRWFITKHDPFTKTTYIDRNKNGQMLSPSEFENLNKSNPNTKFYQTDELYRIAIAKTLFGIYENKADKFLTIYSNRMLAAGTGSAGGGEIKLAQIQKNLQKAAEEPNIELIKNITATVLSNKIENKKHEELIDILNKITKISDIQKLEKYSTLLFEINKRLKHLSQKLINKTNNLKAVEETLVKNKSDQIDLSDLRLKSESDLKEMRLKKAKQTELNHDILILQAEIRSLSNSQNNYIKTKNRLESIIKNTSSDLEKSKQLLKLSMINKDEKQDECDTLTFDIDNAISKFETKSITKTKIASTTDIDLLTKTYKSQERLLRQANKIKSEMENSDQAIDLLNSNLDKIINTVLSISYSVVYDYKEKQSIERLKLRKNDISVKIKNEIPSLNKLSEKAINLRNSYNSTINNINPEFKLTSENQIQYELDYLSELKQKLETKSSLESKLISLSNDINNFNNQIYKLEKQINNSKNELTDEYDYSNDLFEKNKELNELAKNTDVDFMKNIDVEISTQEKLVEQLRNQDAKLTSSVEINEKQRDSIKSEIEYLSNLNKNIISDIEQNQLSQLKLFTQTEIDLDDILNNNFTISTEISEKSKLKTISEKIQMNNSSSNRMSDSELIENHSSELNLLDRLKNKAFGESPDSITSLNDQIEILDYNIKTIELNKPLHEEIEKITDIIAKHESDVMLNKDFNYINNSYFSGFVTDLQNKHQNYNEMLDTAESIMASNKDTSKIRVKLSHEFNDVDFNDNMKLLVNTTEPIDAKIPIIEAVINQAIPGIKSLPIAELEKIKTDVDTINLIKESFDYRTWVNVNLFIARGKSDQYQPVNQTLINNLSGGERSYIAIVPSLTMVAMHLNQSKKEEHPNFMMFDEFAAFLDRNNASTLTEITASFDLSFIATTPAEREANLINKKVPFNAYYISKGTKGKANGYTKIFEYKNGKTVRTNI